MSFIPPYRYADAEGVSAARLNEIQAGAPVDLDTFAEIAAELLSLRAQVAALQGSNHTTDIAFLLLE